MAYHSWLTNQERPGIPFAIYDTDGVSLLNLASGYTATAELVRAGTTTLVATVLNVDITLASTSPNLIINKWSTTVLTAITADLTAQTRTAADYEVRPYVRLTADSTDEVPTSHVKLVVTFKAAAA